jgi:hypothetical protein
VLYLPVSSVAQQFPGKFLMQVLFLMRLVKLSTRTIIGTILVVEP